MGFFGLSGNLITQSWKSDQDLGRFATRRALRIGPGYLTALGIAAAVVTPLIGCPLTLRELVYPAAGVAAPDAPLYSIPWEITCYAAVPLCYKVFIERPIIPWLLFTVMATLAILEPAGFLFRLFAAFLAGGLSTRLHWPKVRLPRLPDISYGTYLYGWPIQVLLIRAGIHDPWLLLATALPLALMAGWLSFRMVEKPAMTLRHNLRLGASYV